MKTLKLSDITLRESAEEVGQKAGRNLTFQQKIEAVQILDRLNLSVIELGTVSGKIADTLLIKAVAANVTDSIVAVSCEPQIAVLENTWNALKQAAHPRMQIAVPVSVARMEYVCHKKPDTMLAAVTEAISVCRDRFACPDIEFIAEDATRADFEFLKKCMEAAVSSGATTVTVCDSAGVFLADECGTFIAKIKALLPETVALGFRPSDALSLASGCAVSAITAGADELKVSAVPLDTASLAGILKILAAKSGECGVTTAVRITEITRALDRLSHICEASESVGTPFEAGVRPEEEAVTYTAQDTEEDVMRGVASLGYELNEDDRKRFWDSFCRIARKKGSVGIKELDVILAAETMQVPAAYTLVNYVVTTGNAIDILAHVKLKRNGVVYDGLSLGDGPIDAAFLAIEKITGHHFELDDFQIQAITEGREAMGQTVVRLRVNGRVYSGRGISTDIIGSGIEAYISALNKVVYEEENA